MAPRKENKPAATDNIDGSIHNMSMVVGELKGAVDHLNNNFKMKDTEATIARDKLHENFHELKTVVVSVKADVQRVDDKVVGVQQDVTEMNNAMKTAEVTLDDYRQSKPTATEAIAALKELQLTVRRFEHTESRALGWWDFIYRIGWIGWTFICGLGAAAIGLGFYWLQRFL